MRGHFFFLLSLLSFRVKDGLILSLSFVCAYSDHWTSKARLEPWCHHCCLGSWQPERWVAGGVAGRAVVSWKVPLIPVRWEKLENVTWPSHRAHLPSIQTLNRKLLLLFIRNDFLSRLQSDQPSRLCKSFPLSHTYCYTQLAYILHKMIVVY